MRLHWKHPHPASRTLHLRICTLHLQGKCSRRALDGITCPGFRLQGDDEEEIVVATTRPETMLGDVAVSAHPHCCRHWAWSKLLLASACPLLELLNLLRP